MILAYHRPCTFSLAAAVATTMAVATEWSTPHYGGVIARPGAGHLLDPVAHRQHRCCADDRGSSTSTQYDAAGRVPDVADVADSEGAATKAFQSVKGYTPARMLGLGYIDVVRTRVDGHDDHESMPRDPERRRGTPLHFALPVQRPCVRCRHAHQGDQMVSRRFVPSCHRRRCVGRVHAHLAPPGLEDQPTRASAQRILDVGPAEDVAKKMRALRGHRRNKSGCECW